ncbi:MAG TPA: Xaa-Pro peptidase family protein [Solirubrobacter sp.]|nr:Xaa-Pro peptidase family protein [Solirubrobacter sp.]
MPQPAHEEYRGRLDRVREQMERTGVDCLLVGPSTDLLYLTGLEARQSERMKILMVPRDGEPRFVIPAFELPHLEALPPLFEAAPWEDGDQPAELLASLLPRNGKAATVAVGAQLHTHFTLRIQDAAPDARYVSGEAVLEAARMRKTPYEVATLRAASEAADRVFEQLIELPIEGRSERDVLAEIRRLLVANGHDALTGGGIVGFGANGASPHHHASERRAAAGDAAVVDYGGVLGGYHSDTTRTFHLGAPSDEFRTVYEIVAEANDAAVAAAGPGVTAEQVDRVARGVIERAGYGERFLHRTGHGIGLDGHEAPYLVAGDTTVLEEGMTFSIEPGVYLDGRFGVRIEDIVVVTADGVDRLNRSTHELMVV